MDGLAASFRLSVNSPACNSVKFGRGRLRRQDTLCLTVKRQLAVLYRTLCTLLRACSFHRDQVKGLLPAVCTCPCYDFCALSQYSQMLWHIWLRLLLFGSRSTSCSLPCTGSLDTYRRCCRRVRFNVRRMCRCIIKVWDQF